MFSPIFTGTDIKWFRHVAAHKSIIVARPERGNVVVTSDGSRYLESMLHLISDASKFISISESLEKITFRPENSINRLLSKLGAPCVLSDSMYHNLYASGSSPSLLYDLLKNRK